jgi:hypothetical protein
VKSEERQPGERQPGGKGRRRGGGEEGRRMGEARGAEAYDAELLVAGGKVSVVD